MFGKESNASAHGGGEASAERDEKSKRNRSLHGVPTVSAQLSPILATPRDSPPGSSPSLAIRPARHTACVFIGVVAVILILIIPPAPAAIWDWPTEGPHTVVRDFCAPSSPWGPGHRGLDLAATSTEIRVPAPGVISMEPVTALVTAGDVVARGDVIAQLEPGHCAELCLHLGLREGGKYRSPRRELGVLQRAVLLPLGDYARG